MEINGINNSYFFYSDNVPNVDVYPATADDFYCDVFNKPQQILNWNEDTSNIQYQGIILARKADIIKEVTSISAGGGFKKIPFLKDSRYKDDFFYPKENDETEIPIRIELYSFEDIYKLASSRNDVFFRLLKNEFEVVEDKEEAL